MLMLRERFLSACNIVALAFRKCCLCGDYGVEDTSHNFLGGMCHECAVMYQKALDAYGATALVDAYIKEYGFKELKREFGGYNYNPMALRIEEEDNVPCDEEVPCFDAFPYSQADVEKMLEKTVAKTEEPKRYLWPYGGPYLTK